MTAFLGSYYVGICIFHVAFWLIAGFLLNGLYLNVRSFIIPVLHDY